MKKSANGLNEKDLLTDILTGEKDLVKLYSTSLTEASGKDVRKTLKTNMSETAEDQFSVFSTMKEKGYYQPKPADKAMIDEKIESFSKSPVCRRAQGG